MLFLFFKSSQVTTEINKPISILLPHGITKQELQRWRDSLSYSILGLLLPFYFAFLFLIIFFIQNDLLMGNSMNIIHFMIM